MLYDLRNDWATHLGRPHVLFLVSFGEVCFELGTVINDPSEEWDLLFFCTDALFSREGSYRPVPIREKFMA